MDEAHKLGCFFCRDCDAVRCSPEIKSKLRRIAEQSGKRQWWNVMVYVFELQRMVLRAMHRDINIVHNEAEVRP